MPAREPLITTLTTQGHVALPMSIRRALRWNAGTRLLVEQTSTGVSLKAAPQFAPTRDEDVFGCLTHEGPPRSVEEMNETVLDEARRRHARD